MASAAEVQRAEQQAAVAQAKERAVRDRAARQRQAQWAESERRDAVRRSEAEAEAAAAVEAAAQEARAAEQAEAARANLADGSASGDGAESLLHDDDRSMYIAPAESPEPTAGDVMQVTDAALSTPARQEQLACAALTIQSVFRGRSERRAVTALVSQRESERCRAAAAIQQAFCRFRLARIAAQEQEKARLAAEKAEAARLAAEEAVAVKRRQEACAALTIQSVFRGRSERRVVAALVSQRESERLIQQASRIAAASAIQQAFSRFRARRTKYEVRDESSDFTPLPRSDATKPAKIPTPPVRFLPLIRIILSSVR